MNRSARGRLPLVVSCLTALLVGGVLAAIAFGGSSGERPTQDQRSSELDRGSFEVPTPAVKDGVVQLPTRVAARVAAINARIHECMQRNGAVRFDTPHGGFYYRDSPATSAGACEAEIAASDEYSASTERQQASAAVLPVLRSMGDCLRREGLPEVGTPAPAAVESALASCTAVVNNQFSGAASP